jgi:DNA-binding HxlR family transcriptional regulator
MLEWACAFGLVGALIYTRVVLRQVRRQLVLEILRRFEVRATGTDLVQSSGGALRRGTVHALLHELEDDGLVERTVVLGRAWYRARKPDELPSE